MADTPSKLTASLSLLNNSNQSGPVIGFAIHSLIASEVTSPRDAAPLFAVPGVGEESRPHSTSVLPIEPIELLSIWNP